QIAVFVRRIDRNFQYNAFYLEDSKTVTMLAPFMHRETFQSQILKEPFITLSTLGHELYHSLFSPMSPALHSLYDHRGECVAKHYKKSCTKFAIGACASGRQTFDEDSPDLESYRLLHSILQDNCSEQELNAKIEGLETTLEQAFFYYAASEYCSRDVERSEELARRDEHSDGNIRVNAAFSLMPEFTKAFQCEEGDRMFVKQEEACYLFGPNS
ncbi:hypothetical protein PMAYCL1PPCAC_32710, partial [Pristionchus mayeri]